MNDLQEIKIDDKEYLIVDSIQNLRAEDSFIHRKNKLEMHKGNGEARKYVGSYTGGNSGYLRSFFEYTKWGVRTTQDSVWKKHTIQSSCFFSKQNLLKYLNDAKVEYQLQEQIYRSDISQYYDARLQTIEQLEMEKIYFSIDDISDKEGSGTRAYIRSNDDIWNVWRELILPKISYLSILKLKSKDESDTTPLYYFRVFMDYQFRSIIHPKLPLADTDLLPEENNIAVTTKTSYREGQALYRKRVIEHMPQCPFTKISDERLLIASHIKPYQVCMNEGNTEEAYDYYNGLALSPTYDKLFDRGFITFSDEGELICGTQLSPYTWEQLKINPKAKNKMRIYHENRAQYLEYHRQNVFQDNLDDLI